MSFDTAQIMPNGQITLPVDIRQKLNLRTGDSVALIYKDDRVIMMNPNIYAMGGWEKTSIKSEDDILELRREIGAEQSRSIIDSLSMPVSADIDFDPPRITIGIRQADFS